MSNTLPYRQGPAAAMRPQCGTVTLSFTGLVSGSATFVIVTFPTPFTTVPKVVCSLSSGAAGTAALVPRALSKTTTAFACYVYNTGTASSTASVSVDWIATV